MKISFCSRQTAERLLSQGFPQRTAVISFYQSGAKPVDYAQQAALLLSVPYDDFQTELPEAIRIATLIKFAVAQGMDILCQCEAGQSRSAGLAAAIREYYEHNGNSILNNPELHPDETVYYAVLEALESDEADYSGCTFHTYAAVSGIQWTPELVQGICESYGAFVRPRLSDALSGDKTAQLEIIERCSSLMTIERYLNQEMLSDGKRDNQGMVNNLLHTYQELESSIRDIHKGWSITRVYHAMAQNDCDALAAQEILRRKVRDDGT